MSALPAMALLAATAANPQVIVDLPASVRMQQAGITLGSLARIHAQSPACEAALAAIPLGPSPVPGTTAVMHRQEIEALVAARGGLPQGCLAAFEGAAAVVVSSDGEPARIDVLQQQARKALEAALDGHFEQVDVKGEEGTARPFAVLPGTSYEFMPQGVDRPRARMVVDMIVHEPEHAAWRYPFWFEVSVRRQAWQLEESLSEGRSLADARKHLALVDVAGLSAQPVAADFRISDEVARQPLAAGSILTVDVLTRAPDVAAGSAVALRYRYGGLEVQTDARALQSGYRGERVRVRNVRSGEDVDGYVDGHNDVQVMQ